jgi:hypothetical protein
MTPRTHTPPPIRAGIVKIGAYDVRIRPHRGVSTPPWLWDVLDLDERTGQLVTVATFCSWPDEAQCATAISNHRAKRSMDKMIAEATARAQHDLTRYAGRVSTDGSVRPVRNGQRPKRQPVAAAEPEVVAVASTPEEPPARAEKQREPRKAWTPEEDDIIRAHYATETAAELLKRLPGRSKSGLYVRVMTLGVTKGRGNRQARFHPRPKPTEQEPRDGTNQNGQHA